MLPDENGISDARDIPSIIYSPITPPLQVYQQLTPLPSEVTYDIDPPSPSLVPTASSVMSLAFDLPIVLRKDIRFHHLNPKYACVLSYECLSTSYVSFVSALDFMFIPKSTSEVMTNPNLCHAMVEEMATLRSNNTWGIVNLSPDKTTVGCQWVYIVKVGLDGQIDRLKAHLVAKGYTHIFGLDYGDTFSSVAKISLTCLFLAMVNIHHWSLHKLDIKNVFL